jgi:phosphate/sulfate permease
LRLPQSSACSPASGAIEIVLSLLISPVLAFLLAAAMKEAVPRVRIIDPNRKVPMF